jgi:hypothetical protein
MFDHLVHIHQQYKQRDLSIQLQRFKTVVTKSGTLRYEIEAYNEYLLLTNAAVLPIGTRIISDTNSLEVSTTFDLKITAHTKLNSSGSCSRIS